MAGPVPATALNLCCDCEVTVVESVAVVTFEEKSSLFCRQCVDSNKHEKGKESEASVAGV